MSDKLLWAWCEREPNLSSFAGFCIGQQTGQRSCTILSVWWTPTFSIIARRSPGVSWAFICCLSSIISTGKCIFTVFWIRCCLIRFQWRLLDLLWCCTRLQKSNTITFSFLPIFFICRHGLFPAEVWSTPWWASNRQGIWRNKRKHL